METEESIKFHQVSEPLPIIPTEDSEFFLKPKRNLVHVSKPSLNQIAMFGLDRAMKYTNSKGTCRKCLKKRNTSS